MRQTRAFARRVTSIIATSLVLLATATAYAEPMDAEFERLISQAAEAEASNLGLAWMTAAERLTLYLPREKTLQVLESALKFAKNPLVRFELARAVTQARHELRNFEDGYDGMKGPLGSQGCLVTWDVVGPFPNESMEGFTTAYGPETATPGPFEGTLSQIDWRPLPRHDRYCVFPLSTTIQPAAPSVVYVSTQIINPKQRTERGRLLLGVNGAYKAWLNGEQVAEEREDQGLNPDNEAWKIALKPGKNTLVLKLASTADGGLGFIARVTDEKLNPLAFDAARARPAKALRAVGELEPAPEGVLSRVSAAASTLSGDAAVWNAWLYKRAAWQNVATPWRDVAERALKAPETLSPRVHALSAELYEEYWRRVDILESAHQRAPGDPWITMSLAEALDQSINEVDVLRSRALKERLVREHKDFLLAYTRYADWLEGRGFDEEAMKVLESYAAKTRMTTPAYFTRYVDFVETLGPIKDLQRLKEDGLNFMAVSSGYWWDLITQRLAQGQVDDALEMIREYRKITPASRHAARKEAEILRARGAFDEALAIIDEQIAQSPGDASLYQTRADFLVAQGRTDDAIEALETALEQRPQDQQIREYLSHLRPDELRFWEDWMIEDVRKVASEVTPGAFNYDGIIDQTVVHVSPNGLAQQVNQRVDRVLTPDGIDSAATHRVAFTMGDERVDILRVRVHKADGSISEDFDQWESGGSRKGSTTYNDTAYVTVRANNVKPGDLVEVRYRLSQVANQNFRGDYFGDIAYLQGARPIGFARYAAIYPETWDLHFRPPALPHERVDNKMPDGDTGPEGFKITSFDLKNLPHVESDPGQPGATDVYDYILVSNKKTYDEIGNWWWTLVKEQLIVDDAIRAKVQELIKNAKTDDEKIQAIHNYVVKNTRYLHVGLGIHGWKPYRTTTAFRNRYGDCKDKASLLKVMLEEAGIPANLVLVRTRRLGKVESFPASMHVFNHAITYVPGKDLFLDGTAEFNGTRELTSMDQGAQALIVEDGGSARFLELPVDKPDQNLLRAELEVDLTGEEPVARGTFVAHGANAVWLRTSLEDPERRDETFEKQLASDYPGAKLLSAKYEHLGDLESPTKITFTFTSPQLQREDGARAFLLPMAEEKDLLGAYAKQSNRTQDLTIRVPFANQTTVKYRIPPSRKFDKMPQGTSLKSKFGGLDIAYTQDGNELVVEVKYSIDVQRIAVEDYGEFRSFLSKATDALNETIGLSEEK